MHLYWSTTTGMSLSLQHENTFGLQTGLFSLLHDNSSESGHTINAIHRFNIFQEIILAMLYRFTPFQVIGTYYCTVSLIRLLTIVHIGIHCCNVWNSCRDMLKPLSSTSTVCLFCKVFTQWPCTVLHGFSQAASWVGL